MICMGETKWFQAYYEKTVPLNKVLMNLKSIYKFANDRFVHIAADSKK